jgi:hypothetical protein
MRPRITGKRAVAISRLQRELLLAGIVLALGGGAYTGYVQWTGTTSSPAPAASNPQDRPRAGRPGEKEKKGRGEEAEAPDVHLETLTAERPRPDTGRDLFRFKPRPLPPPPPPPPPRVPTPAELAAAQAPPPPPPIALKFIGFVESDGSGRRIAFLSDGRGSPVSAKEGDTVLGQYRVLRIGTESIEMAYLDGRGRQTIRLSGS